MDKQINLDYMFKALKSLEVRVAYLRSDESRFVQYLKNHRIIDIVAEVCEIWRRRLPDAGITIAVGSYRGNKEPYLTIVVCESKDRVVDETIVFTTDMVLLEKANGRIE